MRVLVLFANPPDQLPLRLDQEDSAIRNLARQFADTVTVETQHASQIDDAHALISNGSFDVIQFSGHGNPSGIILDKSDIQSGRGQLVSADRFEKLMDSANKPPHLVLLLSCYSDHHVSTLANAAPFVITTTCDIDDSACIQFIRAFYESLFRMKPVQTSFENALNLLTAKGMPAANFRLSRRCLVHKQGHRLIESKPERGRNSIWVNLDQVADKLGSFGMPEEELCHLLARKLKIHAWIFDIPRERAILPIGSSLFGEFSWQNALDLIFCTRLMKLSSATPLWHWDAWSRALTSYNDLAAHEYRNPDLPPGQTRADPARRPILEDAVRLFSYITLKYFEPIQTVIEKHQRFQELVPHIRLAVAEVEKATDYLKQRRLREVVITLELALTNCHQIADGLLPLEEK